MCSDADGKRVEDTDFFSTGLGTLGVLGPGVPLGVLGALGARQTKEADRLALSDLAAADQDGVPVARSAMKFPHSIEIYPARG
jgi:hypothetical protein